MIVQEFLQLLGEGLFHYSFPEEIIIFSIIICVAVRQMDCVKKTKKQKTIIQKHHVFVCFVCVSSLMVIKSANMKVPLSMF